MSGNIPTKHLQSRIATWSAQLRAMGLSNLVDVLLEAAEPLGPLGAQVLWIAQPALRLVAPSDEIDGLARLLDDPSGMVWLRTALNGTQQTDDEVK
jgi:hypothetical protein